MYNIIGAKVIRFFYYFNGEIMVSVTQLLNSNLIQYNKNFVKN